MKSIVCTDISRASFLQLSTHSSRSSVFEAISSHLDHISLGSQM